MCNVANKYPGTIDNYIINYDIEWSDGNIENNRKYWSMKKSSSTSGINMRKYSFCTPEIEHIAHRKSKKGNHSKKYWRNSISKWKTPKREEYKYHYPYGWEESNYYCNKEHHPDSYEINFWRTNEFFSLNPNIRKGIIVFWHSIQKK